MSIDLISYQHDQKELQAFVAYPSSPKAPLVILCHAWRGRDEFICEKAQELAHWGYVGFSLDMYGRGVLGHSKLENAALKKPFVENRELLQKRVIKGFEMACSLPNVDVERVAVLGFGFGGMCALDLARSGVNLKAAVSIYGHFIAPSARLIKPIQAKILALHGYQDPIVSQTELRAFEEEMNAAKVDWQLHLYGEAMHAFATPGSNDPASGILYHHKSACRAWRATCSFLKETLGEN